MEADFVIVGSGSAGSALAYRLGEDGRNSVLVLERGGSDFGPLIQMPSAFSIPMNMGRYNWDFVSAPEPHLGGRRLAVPRGKVIGGSSSINGMVFVRGHAGDFDAWETMGARGWGYRSVLPYFKRMETSHGGEPGWRGTDGPVHVTRGRSPNPLYGAFIEAGRQAGYGITEDYNGHRQEGFGKLEMTVWQGRRWSAANAYLRPALKRQNIGLETGVDVRRVLFEGRRAIGVEIARGGGRIERVRARREVIICASAINSPKILQLSGIGDAGHLRAHGIEVVADRPGVGANLQDHLEIYMQFAAKKPITLYSHLNWLSKLWIGATWLAFKSGLGATNHFEAGAFIRSRAGVRYPDIQFHFLPAAVRYDGRAVAKTHGFQMHVGPMRSKSRGHVRITSAAPEAAPEIRFNYLSMDEDREDFRACVRLTREIARQPALSDYLAYELTPGDSAQVDEALDEFVRSHVESAYHPCGTCRMGAADDPLAVVDSECRAIGVEGLRVVDSSIFPQIPNGNLNAPSMMVGEKAADLVLGRQPLPPSNLQPWVHPEWETAQR